MTQYRVQGEPRETSTPSAKARVLRWLVGWVLLPLLCLGGLFVWGMHWGAHNPDSQWISLTRWVAVKVFDVDAQMFADSLEGSPGEEGGASR